MPTKSSTQKRQNTRVELMMLALASLACVTVLTALLATSGRQILGQGAVPGSTWLLAGLVAGAAAVAGYFLFQGWATMRRQARRAGEEARELRRALAASEALIKAEPQVLLHWEPGRGFAVVANTLTGVPGLPTNPIELARFGFWLDQKSNAALKSSLDGLLAGGRAFNLILKTAAGGHVEADGRAAGGRAVLRFKDVAGYKRDLSVILDQHMRLARDVRSARALLNALPHPAWLRDVSGRLTWVNAAYVRAVDAETDSEVVNGGIELLESRQRKAVAKVLKTGQPFKERMPLVVGSERKSHEVMVLPLGDATAGTAIDVADLESAKGEHDRQIAAYDRTLDRVATAVAIYSAEQKLTFFNAAYQKLWHLDADWLATAPGDGDVLDRLRELGRLPEVVNYREWKSKVLQSYKDDREQEDWWHLPDGRTLHVMATQRPDGGVTYLYVDETERLTLESKYNELIGVRNETLDSLKEGVAVFGTDGRLKLHNSALAFIWKLSPQKLKESPHIDEFIHLTKVLHGEPATWVEISSAVTSYEDREPLEGQMIRPDASVLDYAVTPLPDGGTLLTFVDVTDSKKYQRVLIERNEALETADRLKDEFIGHISYELRTPLTNIIGFSELLSNPIFGSLTQRQREYLDDISFSSKTLLAIIDDILDLVAVDAGELELKLVPVDVRAMLDRAIDGVRERAARARLTLDIAVGDDAATFVADAERVRKVLQNLLSNAVGFSKPEGVVRISCWREDGAMVFSVEDEGVGIPKEQQSRIFDRFESKSQGGKHRGAGLGLSIVKSLVDLHGGTMELDSEPGRGTKVTVRFPERGLEQQQDIPASPDAARLARN